MPYVKLALACLVALAISLFATGFERIHWLYSGGGLVAVVPQRIYGAVPGVACQRPSIEVKRDGDGVLRYRCGDYWLLSTEARSTDLTDAWPQIDKDRRSETGRHP